MSHGYTVDHEKPDPLVELADNALAEFSLAAEAGKWMVDMMPFCKKKRSAMCFITSRFSRSSDYFWTVKYIPDWFPGTSFKRVATEWRGVLDQTVDQPHAFVKQQMVSCFESNL